jgi:hypothetical protein
MNADLKNFMAAYLRIVLMTLMPIALVAFLSIPYSLGGHPGEPTAAANGSDLHMT